MIYLTYKTQQKNVAQNQVDEIIEKNPGIVYRSRTAQCNHGENSKCLKCSAIQVFLIILSEKVFDEEYIQTIEPPPKHIPFHVFIRRQLSKAKQKNNFLLDTIRCSILPGCNTHAPWPDAICTRCQPSSMILTRQEFRNIDNIMFENHQEVETFINYWRKTMCQRVGFLYGKYEPMDNIPLGIRATVHAIYEPPQINAFDMIKLLPDPFEIHLEEVARAQGYQKIGWILTDLLVDPTVKGKTLNTRTSSSYLLSAQECITAAYYQNQHPNPCSYSPTGFYGSKFVTVVVTGSFSIVNTGNDKGDIDFYGWQVSNQCMALVQDDCLVPTVDVPGLAYTRNQSATKFIPEVSYMGTDEFNNSVLKAARPVPVDYFLVQVPTGFPINPSEERNAITFPHANRNAIGDVQRFINFEDFCSNPLSYLDNIHFVSYLYSLLDESLKQQILIICQLKSSNDEPGLSNAIKDEKFSQIKEFIKFNVEATTKSSSNPNPRNPPPYQRDIVDSDLSAPEDPQESFTPWTCNVCTFFNLTPQYDSESFICCEMCSIPKDS
ncbi:hypothetical protein MXB_2478 [Myxobolus squamalis]|nr:hypothetical protein MXB_2478 [Myxobolus squamalis]